MNEYNAMKESFRPSLIITVFLITLGALFYITRGNKTPKPLSYNTSKPQNRDIERVIDATGKLKIKGSLRVGSLISGIVKTIHVQEGDVVNKNQPILTLSSLSEEFTKNISHARLKRAHAALSYQKNHLARLQTLGHHNQIAADTLELETAKYKELEAEFFALCAAYAQESRRYELHTIKAPEAGTVIGLHVTQGEAITTDLNATVICEIAPSLDTIEVRLEIDESDVCATEPGQEVRLYVDSSPDREYIGTLDRVSYTPRNKGGSTYEGIVTIANDKKAFRPGMTIHATIKVSSASQVLSIPNQSFAIQQRDLEKIAQKIGHTVIPAEKKAGKAVWVASGKNFKQVYIRPGITDDSVTQAIEGLDADSEVIIDAEAANELDEIYAKIARS
jgi:HlyD family secretion protein